MPTEYRCDGACKRILSDLGAISYWDEIDRKYCSDADYPRLLAARAKFQTTVQTVVDNAYSVFLKELGNFIAVPLIPQVTLIAISDKTLTVPKTDKTGAEIKPPKP